jgi:hypothetical protein
MSAFGTKRDIPTRSRNVRFRGYSVYGPASPLLIQIKSGTFCKVSSQQARLGRLWEDPKATVEKLSRGAARQARAGQPRHGSHISIRLPSYPPHPYGREGPATGRLVATRLVQQPQSAAVVEQPQSAAVPPTRVRVPPPTLAAARSSVSSETSKVRSSSSVSVSVGIVIRGIFRP